MTTFILKIIGILLEADYPYRPAIVTATSARLSSKRRGDDFRSAALGHLQFIRWFRSFGRSVTSEENRFSKVP